MSTFHKMYRLSTVRAVVLAACAVSAAALPAIAQDSSAPPPPPPGEGRGGPGMQERQLEMMTKQLNLTPDQVTQIKAIQADGRAKMMALREDTTTAGSDKRAKMMAMREAEQAKVRAVLTDDQKPKYDAMLERMKERREHGPGPGGTDAPPPPPPSSTL